jgi:hypothetical protein
MTGVALAQTPIPQSNWSVHSVSSEEPGDGSYASNAFDGNPATMWHTQWIAASPAPPHTLQIDLGASYAVSGFRYLPRQDGNPNGRIGGYQFFVSADGASWGTAVASGTFPNTGAEQQVTFTAKTGRYVRIRATSEASGQPWTSIAELNVLTAGGGGGGGSTPAPPTSGDVISRSGWSVRSVDSEETFYHDDAARNAFDGNPATLWHTQWDGGPPPHELQIDLGTTYSVSGFRYLPRQDGNSNGRIAGYQFYVSSDGSNWGTAVASGTWPDGASEQQVTFTAKNGRFIRIRALSEVNGGPWSSIAELNVIASGGSAPGPVNQPPTGTISSPTGDVAIPVGGSVNFGGSGSDPDGNTPLSYAWSFGAGGPAPSTQRNPGNVTFPSPGVYTVTFTVTDSQLLSDPTPATRTITVQSVSGSGGGGGDDFSGLIPQGAFTVRFVDSQETSFSNDAASNAFDGNPGTMWHTEWQGSGPPHELQIDLGGTYPVSGFRYLPRQFGNSNGRIASYQFYVSQDGSNWGTAVASGTWPNTSSEQQVTFSPKTGRFVRIRALSEVNGGPWTSIAELNVIAGSGSVPPPPPSGTMPTRAVFQASADHDTMVWGYVLDIFWAGSNPSSATPLASRDLGKPGVSNGEINVDVADLIAGLGSGNYIATVKAIGAEGDSRSDPSPVFTVP